MDFPLITDPYFYAVAVPAVLLLGISKSGFGAGFGSLAVPLMALTISVPQAAAILMPLLLLMDLLGIAAFRKDFDYPFLKFLVPFGLVGTVVGALLFRVLDAHTVAAIVGGFTLLFLAQRLLFPPRPDSPPPPKWLGALLTITSGFLSKWIPYAWLGLLDWRNMATSLVLLPLAPIGVWVGVRMARTISPVWFYRAIYGGMFLTGVKLLWDGLA